MRIAPAMHEEHKERRKRVQTCLRKLSDHGYSPQDISVAMKDRISWRTLYRWNNGERTPKRRSDVVALEELVARLCVK